MNRLLLAIVGLATTQAQILVDTVAALAREYYDRITAPRKSMLLIPSAGHMALMTQPDSFLKFLLANVRPLALQQ